MRFHFKKRFGQHFLQDSVVLQKILDLIGPTPEHHWIEIGPGEGALTRLLLPKVQALDVIEIDREVIPVLKKIGESYGTGLSIHSADVLKFDFTTLCKLPHHTRVVGNLPYNISTPLLFHAFQYCVFFKDMHFMLQQEVAERITANPASKAYGRLSVMTKWYCKAELLLSVPKQAFYPVPKVNSALVRLTPYKTMPFPNCDISILSKIVAAAFNQRRKTLKNSLKNWFAEAELEHLGISPERRAETLSLEEFVRLVCETGIYENFTSKS